jgi:phage tail tape-measure protein
MDAIVEEGLAEANPAHVAGGAALGGAGGVAAGAVIGAGAGPVGAVIGAVIGAVAGSVAGGAMGVAADSGPALSQNSGYGPDVDTSIPGLGTSLTRDMPDTP